jgi:F0F1-type ATP synthase assembly protein I
MHEDLNKQLARKPSAMQTYGRFASVGFEFLAAMLLPGALGWWIDNTFSTTPWWMLGLGAFGFGVGLYRLLKLSSGSQSL